MFAFLRQVMEERRANLQLEAKPIEADTSMNISKKFFKVLKLSFEIKYLKDDVKPSRKENKIKVIEKRLEVLYNNVIDISTNPKLDDIIALAAAYHNIGQIYVDSTILEEVNLALVCLSRCLELLRGNQLNPKAILTSLDALNELNFILSNKLKTKKYTFEFLNTAMELYLKYTIRDDYPDPVHIAAIVGFKEEESNPKIILDGFHHTTLQDLGILYLLKPKDKHGFVSYMHNLIERQLSQIISENKFDDKSINLALALFDLSQYFIANSRFVEARNYIATADYVLRKFSEGKFKITEEVSPSKKSQFDYLYDNCHYINAISGKYWGTYGVAFLRFWMYKFLQYKEDSCELDISKLEIKSVEESTKLLIFSNLEEELEQITNQIKDIHILNLTEAKSVFIQTLRYLDTANECFTADTDIESHMKITLDISEAYKYLAGFEQHRDKQIKLHKRRVECLEKLCHKFNTTVDADSELLLYKRIWYELVTSCSTVIDLMLEESYYNEPFKDISEEAKRFMKLISLSINMYLNIDS
ncbi:KIF-binding protein isoform X2 [Solenopsis invicta]|uniref:KIF-binding protein isoform X2 n=1 Tax=Solenopsis invicta TaxID=13686 RepID=UPI000595DAC7|nr:KIF-binding protein isoform X2 [Solenopsis invicta]